ncbi:MAG: ThuA domain-containing protein [Candidatus Hermodarchaeota archaeon]
MAFKKKILLCQRGRYFKKDKTYLYFKEILSDYVVDNYEDVEVFNNKDFFDYDTTIFFTQFGEFSEEQEKNLLDFIASGKGFVGVHGASASFKAHPKYYEMIGGRFIEHKKKCNIDIKILDKEHPITADLPDFTFFDEPYRHDFSMKGDMKVLAEAYYHDEEDPSPEPIIWVKTYRKGRVTFCALGHQAKSLKSEIFRRIIKNSVKWVLEGQQ